jgi:hypothetical protein
MTSMSRPSNPVFLAIPTQPDARVQLGPERIWGVYAELRGPDGRPIASRRVPGRVVVYVNQVPCLMYPLHECRQPRWFDWPVDLGAGAAIHASVADAPAGVAVSISLLVEPRA